MNKIHITIINETYCIYNCNFICISMLFAFLQFVIVLEKSSVASNGKISAVLSVSLQPNLKDERQIEIIAKAITTNLVLVHQKYIVCIFYCYILELSFY